jgi:NAD(P)-dependent dehydrogenase (short-subunit alcohol dehydrogenase family)
VQKTAALETAKDNIRINTVHPGMIDTNIQNDAKRDNAEFYEAVAASVPMGRFGTADEVANLVLFLASDEAVYITGGEFVIDGGMTA